MRMTQCCWLSEGMLQGIVDEFDRVCKRRELKVNAGKSKVIVFESPREQTIDFAEPYRVGSEVIQIWLGREKMEEVHEFKYLETIQCQFYINLGAWNER